VYALFSEETNCPKAFFSLIMIIPFPPYQAFGLITKGGVSESKRASESST